MLFLLAVAEEVVDEEEEEEEELSLLLWSLVSIHNLNHTLKTGYYVGLENWNNYVFGDMYKEYVYSMHEIYSLQTKANRTFMIACFVNLLTN